MTSLRRLAPVALVLAVAACRSERVAPTAITSAPDAPPPARRALDAGRTAEIERAWTREAFATWRAQRVADVAPATVEHRVDDIFKCLNCEDLLVTERVIAGDVCRQGPWRLNIAKDDGQPTRFQAEALAVDCCDASCPDRNPAAWMLELNRILTARDGDALRALVSPTEGLHVAAGFSDGEASSHDEATIRHGGPVDEVFDTIQAVQLFHDHIECDERFDDAGVATCIVHGGGFSASYRWRRALVGRESAVYLLEASQQSH